MLHTVDSKLLKEIILIDDHSTKPHLKKRLDKYIRQELPKLVKWIIVSKGILVLLEKNFNDLVHMYLIVYSDFRLSWKEFIKESD